MPIGSRCTVFDPACRTVWPTQAAVHRKPTPIIPWITSDCNNTLSEEWRKISLSVIRTMSEFHQLQFNLLGKRTGVRFLSSAIVIVEEIQTLPS